MPHSRDSELLAAAEAVRARAYAPYSNFHVGTAILADDGNIYVGCNV
ncbi:MAG: cytidine deaminase, partial [Hyphomicrobiales bacterium]